MQRVFGLQLAHVGIEFAAPQYGGRDHADPHCQKFVSSLSATHDGGGGGVGAAPAERARMPAMPSSSLSLPLLCGHGLFMLTRGWGSSG